MATKRCVSAKKATRGGKLLPGFKYKPGGTPCIVKAGTKKTKTRKRKATTKRKASTKKRCKFGVVKSPGKNQGKCRKRKLSGAALAMSKAPKSKRVAAARKASRARRRKSRSVPDWGMALL